MALVFLAAATLTSSHGADAQAGGSGAALRQPAAGREATSMPLQLALQTGARWPLPHPGKDEHTTIRVGLTNRGPVALNVPLLDSIRFDIQPLRDGRSHLQHGRDGLRRGVAQAIVIAPEATSWLERPVWLKRAGLDVKVHIDDGFGGAWVGVLAPEQALQLTGVLHHEALVPMAAGKSADAMSWSGRCDSEPVSLTF